MDVSSYYTRLKVFWDELRKFQPSAECRYGVSKAFVDFQQQEYVIQFLMGLNESYAQARANILMQEPLPTFSKTFSLLIQEERQRTIQQNVFALTDPGMSIEAKSVSRVASSLFTLWLQGTYKG